MCLPPPAAISQYVTYPVEAYHTSLFSDSRKHSDVVSKVCTMIIHSHKKTQCGN